MFAELKHNKILPVVGIILFGGLVIWSWSMWWFHFVFKILVLCLAIYFISNIFKTTVFAGFLIVLGGFLIFTEGPLIGLPLWIVLGTFATALYLMPMLIRYALGNSNSLNSASKDIEKNLLDEKASNKIIVTEDL
jgi:hypothetical protein